mmetsp:Transcript_48571/g.121257  ORF Transcript_48571/g.121257 Transcript_48571/m.121257 type:complete len:105 (+) Transcript_48571:872-1186(+)
MPRTIFCDTSVDSDHGMLHLCAPHLLQVTVPMLASGLGGVSLAVSHVSDCTYAFASDANDEPRRTLLHSKLRTRVFPSVARIVQDLTQALNSPTDDGDRDEMGG